MTLDFILGHYNYWVVIVLMMTGLFIVVAKGNLVKKIIGLNLFQTSVFLLYITIGKIACGTAPILLEDYAGPCPAVEMEELMARQDAAMRDFGVSSSSAGAADADHDADPHGDESKITNLDTAAAKAAMPDASELPGGAATVAEGEAAPAAGAEAVANQDYKTAFEEAQAALGDHDEDEDEDAHGDGHGAPHYADILYSNPLPHVLILTAIVVGVATTAVGLALAVRIREAYGTIEEDELQMADDAVEFGRAPAKGAAA